MSDRTRPGDVVAAWASAQVTRLLDGAPEDLEVPEYGTAEWLDLPGADPRRAAALITAAEQWRGLVDEQLRLDELAEINPTAWYDAVTRAADEEAQRLLQAEKDNKNGYPYSSRPTIAELDARRREYRPAHVVKATPGWSPIGIPGRPGWWRHFINGEQVDLPSRELPQQHREAA